MSDMHIRGQRPAIYRSYKNPFCGGGGGIQLPGYGESLMTSEQILRGSSMAGNYTRTYDKSLVCEEVEGGWEWGWGINDLKVKKIAACK